MGTWLELREREQSVESSESFAVRWGGGDREELIRITVWRMDWKVRVDAGPVRTLFSSFRQ